jgi:hypothetical protein
MELVAMELKQNGCYLARSLSFTGVTFEHLHITIGEDFAALYDEATALWAETNNVGGAAEGGGVAAPGRCCWRAAAGALFGTWGPTVPPALGKPTSCRSWRHLPRDVQGAMPQGAARR